ncbi:MAG: KpsF/GutQ family sugar-phosphate isomerase [Alphaproteobacteria bacterium]|uniref:KpsF/GutQ family sugar-phosphate isomerase n=1 Tax=Candidatus Nitrobium versatile TaxID=2884831 RepID=A0A953M3B0_9BACT|nr:KpsF/GutQ family sugar-phosphate isomerase [Candidatus Nitrobium versatile]
METILDIAKKVLRIEAEAVLALTEKLDGSFERAVDLIYGSKGRVIVTGMGKSGLVGKKIAATLASTGTPAFFLHPAEASHGDLGMVTAEDVIIVLSNSGETEELVRLIPVLERFDISLIALTGNPDSTLAKAADVSLDVSVREEACSLGVVPTSSTTAAMAMGDALAVALLTRRGFRKEDFAFFHPGGSLGKKLLVRVKDLMHSGDSLPLVTPDSSMTGAVMEISSKRLGMTVVIDANGRVIGIITDGDVRRGIEKWGKDFFDLHAGEVMTKDPKTIAEDELAAKALSIMEGKSITALVVPDGEGRARGVIHLHDILRQGIV